MSTFPVRTLPAPFRERLFVFGLLVLFGLISVQYSHKALSHRGAFDRWAEAWELLSGLPGEVEAINLDRGDAFFTALGRLAALT